MMTLNSKFFISLSVSDYFRIFISQKPDKSQDFKLYQQFFGAYCIAVLQSSDSRNNNKVTTPVGLIACVPIRASLPARLKGGHASYTMNYSLNMIFSFLFFYCFNFNAHHLSHDEMLLYKAIISCTSSQRFLSWAIPTHSTSPVSPT